MKKLEGRSLICLLLLLAMTAGLVYFIAKLEINGADWAGFYANDHIFSNGDLLAGELRDRNGSTLLKYDAEGPHYTGEEYERRSYMTVVGDRGLNIDTGANVVFRSRLIGYNPVTGTEGIFGNKGAAVTLSVDKEVNETAYAALGQMDGFVCVYDYTTGDIICLVSTPTVDPADVNAASTAASGAFINKVFSACFPPGSTFKVLTAAAAIEKVKGLDDWTFTCTGSHDVGGNLITCPMAHRTMDFAGALANSCNCAFGQLAVDMGSKTMKKYVKSTGLTYAYDVNGIKTKKGSFNFDSPGIDLAWAGIGQYEDQVNPLSMMVFMGAIAGGGSACEPSIIKGESKGSTELLSSDTAKELRSLLRNNVKANYGDDNYPGLKLGAKSGTAETGEGGQTHAWFVGYSGNCAFCVMVENGGGGADVAGPIANTVLQKIKEREGN